MSTSLSDELRAELCRLGSATIHEAQGGIGALDSRFKPIDPGFRLAGPVQTVETVPADNLALHLAVDRARPGHVLVVDAKGYCEAGTWGDVLATFAQAKGVLGVVINGAVRDAAVLVELNFPVFCIATSMRRTSKKHAGVHGAPVIMGGVQIDPGDVVVGDADGVVAVGRDQLTQVVEASRVREAQEATYREQIKSGISTLDLLNLR